MNKERDYTDEEKVAIMENFDAKMINQMVDMSVDLSMVNENFWEILDESQVS